LPPYSETRYLNAGPEASYVGTAACAECHSRNYRSYLLTPHSRALSDVDPAAEPPDAAFEHKPSGRSYRVYRQDGRLRHQEVLRSEDGQEIARVDLPVRYLVGSGHFCRTYVVEVDGFLHESPITWYTSKQKWAPSPGYDFAQHWGFERPVRLTCLVCHAGRVEEAGGASHRLTFHEKAIGCESCHGPGSLHAAAQRAGKVAPGEDDLTIVHPGKLSRPLLESVCASCHLSGPANVALRGRRTGDFRPGTPLDDYVVHYRFDAGSEAMTVVGHVEQLRRSACYQKSDNLTCVTCHDPHRRQAPPDTVAFYRQKCLDCHARHPCGLAEAERRKKQPADDCAACHMPRGDTDIPHVAFTHHRIGLHAAPPAADPGRLPALVPIEDVSRLPPLEQQRNLGLAYLEVVRDPRYSRYAEPYRERARQLLEDVHEAGLPDGPTSAGLAALYWDGSDPTRAAACAREALEAKDLPAQDRPVVLFLLGNLERQYHNYDSAVALLEEATRVRRFGEDWSELGACYLDAGKPEKAAAAFETALAIRPYRPATQNGLAEAYRRLGDLPRSRQHREKAQWLLQHQQE
jgi:tetratricopeptide (TPR) repeat protein